MFSSVRLRLTGGYVAVLGAVLLLFSAGAYVVIQHNLLSRVDLALRSTLLLLNSALEHQQLTSGDDIAKVLSGLHPSSQSIAILDSGGRLLAEYPSIGGTKVRLPSNTSPPSPEKILLFYSLPEQTDESDDSCRGVMQQVRLSGTNASYLLVVNQSLEPVAERLDLLFDFFVITVPLTLALAGFGGWLLAGRTLAPVVQMAEHARRIGAENLDERLAVSDARNEFGRLASTFNGLLERLSYSFSQQRQFMADASHEIRTPLSVIQTTSAVTLQRENREPSEYREALTVIEQQARRLTRIVQQMFVLARADAGHPSLEIADLYVEEVIRETAQASAILAEQKHLHLEIPILPEMPFRGDEGLLRQLFSNLLDNAIKFTPEHGSISIEVERTPEEYTIAITNTGIEIPQEIRPHLFERFFHADKPHSKTTDQDGAGLGLAMARWIADAHSGRIELRQSDATGTTFVVSLRRT